MKATVTIEVIDTGYCVARASLVASGTGWTNVRCHAPAFLLRHAQRGAMLFDTGYAPRLLDAFARWPERLYQYATPTVLGTPLAEGLRKRGVLPEEVGVIIVSHLHADHVAGLRDFPASRFVVAREAMQLQQSTRGLDAVRRGIVQQLFPDDFGARADVIDAYTAAALPHLGPTHDLFGDGSIHLLPLPGHARGQLGALVRTAAGEVLLCADGAWTSRAYRELRAPHWVTALLQDDIPALRATLRSIRDFARVRPDVAILPTHCPETLGWVERRHGV
jgi:glyoxylase-like metal-dependent hydrolase (beta-lactamase superfamily II)